MKDNESAVLFAVCLSSLSAMSASDVELLSGLVKPKAVATFKAAAEHALMRASLLAAEDLFTLQAFVLHLSLRRFTDGDDGDANSHSHVYTLTALAHRLANGTPRNESPLDREMRNRLQWEL